MSTHANEERIFNDALAIDDLEERAFFLDRECATDLALRRSVESLLDSYAMADCLDFTQQHVSSLIQEAFSELPENTRFGRYEVLEQLGEGGMGDVYLAENVESPVDGYVALKVIKPGMDSRQLLARFQLEQETLKRLDHPGIARFIDSGVSDSGRAYFAMELFHGLPITRFCDREKLAIAERVRLLIQVCNAVAHAHSQGIVHRDIKPANILVAIQDGEPVVKVIDFGVAKAIYNQSFESKPATRVLQFLGTPNYMSPEQMRWSSDVDERTDVYSLGVLFYELLTGSPPIPSNSVSTDQYDLHALRMNEDFTLPSEQIARMPIEELSVVSTFRSEKAQQLRIAVKGDLDWIAFKATELDRHQRYANVSAFSDDLHRYIVHRPTVAKPPSVIKRWSKFVRRNRGIIAGSLTSLLCGFAILGIAWASMAIRTAQRRQAQLEDQKSTLGVDTIHQQFVHDLQLAGEHVHLGEWKSTKEVLDKWLQPDSRYRDHFVLNYIRGLVTEPLFALHGHRNDVLDMDLSPDARLIASSDKGGEIVVWDAVLGLELCRLHPSEQELIRVRFSPNGRMLATAGQDRIVRLFDVATWSLEAELTGHERTINGLDWSPDGEWLATGSRDGDVRIWNVATREYNRSLPRHEGPVRCLVWSPDGKWLATADGEIGVHVWSTNNWNERQLIQTHGKGVLAIVFSADSRFVAMGGYMRQLLIVETGEFRNLQLSVLSYEINSLKFGNRYELFSGGTEGELELLQYSGPKQSWESARREQISKDKGAVRSIAIPVSENRIYAASCQDREVLGLSHYSFVACNATEPLPIPVGFIEHSKLVLITDEKGFNATLRDAETDRILLKVTDKVRRKCQPLYSASRDMVYLACGENDHSQVYIVRRSDGEITSRLPFPGSLDGLSLSRDSQYLVAAGWNGKGIVRAWDLDTLAFTELPHGHGQYEAVAKFSPKDDILVVGSAGTRKLTCLRSGTWEKIREVDTYSPWGTFEFARLNNWLVVGETKKISLWEPDLKHRLWSSAFEGMDWHERIHHLTFAPDESAIVGYSGQTTIRFWDCKTRSEMFAQIIPRGGAEWLHFADSGTLHVHATDGWYVLSGTHSLR